MTEAGEASCEMLDVLLAVGFVLTDARVRFATSSQASGAASERNQGKVRKRTLRHERAWDGLRSAAQFHDGPFKVRLLDRGTVHHHAPLRCALTYLHDFGTRAAFKLLGEGSPGNRWPNLNR